ncbi:MAG: GspE/PulE family protein [Planctomycetota bacterium]|jgi:type II secretory ATPase GspE/PulE/Tfp pilus assembly ATPase PilB-like protein
MSITSTNPTPEAATTAMAIDVSELSVEDAIQTLIEHALSLNASDLFIASDENLTRIHVRALGIVHQISATTLEDGVRYVAHVKALADMDVGEKRRPLDGRWLHRTEDDVVTDLRINSIPTMYGEDIAIRLLPRETDLHKLENLGFLPSQLNTVTNMLQNPGGMILCTGSTGSGKTATLYSCLRLLNDGSRKINTIEDPIEFAIDGIRQSAINNAIDLGFSDLLRAVLRQAPDVIMIGEIRDPETAQIAVRAANSGHLVFATLHAQVAAGAIQSLHAFGVNPHFLASALRGVISQRLVRTLCDSCKKSFDLSSAPETFESVREHLTGDEGKSLFASGGCESCNQTGYTGRSGVFEVMPVTRSLRQLIAEGRPVRDIRFKAIEEGMIEFRQAALIKVAQGVTSTEEVFRTIPAEHLLLDD